MMAGHGRCRHWHRLHAIDAGNRRRGYGDRIVPVHQRDGWCRDSAGFGWFVRSDRWRGYRWDVHPVNVGHRSGRNRTGLDPVNGGDRRCRDRRGLG